jgi:hypothetical protein
MRVFIAGLTAAIACLCAAAPAAAQAVEASGSLSVRQSFMFNLDNGTVGRTGDIWFHAVTDSQRFLEPRGRAQMAVGDGSDRGFAGCAVAQYSTARVALSAVPVGSFVCVLTDEGRISQFRRTANITQNRLTLTFTTWALQPFP